MEEQMKIELVPDYNLLKKYLKRVSENKMIRFNLQLLRITDFDTRFCDLIEEYKLQSCLSDIYYFAGSFEERIQLLNNSGELKYNQRGKDCRPSKEIVPCRNYHLAKS